VKNKIEVPEYKDNTHGYLLVREDKVMEDMMLNLNVTIRSVDHIRKIKNKISFRM